MDFGTGRKFGTDIAKRYGEGSEMPVFFLQAKEAFLLSDNSIWSLPSFPPLAITAFRGPEDFFSLAIIAFEAFRFIVPKC